jgi:hypothetical protein
VSVAVAAAGAVLVGEAFFFAAGVPALAVFVGVVVPDE